MKRLLVAAGLSLLILLAMMYRDRLDIEALRDFISDQGQWQAPLVFVAVYALATLLFLPGSLLTLLGGLLFGPFWGTLFNLAGASLGASLSFLVARYLAADWVERSASGVLRQLKQGIEKEGWRFVAFVRMVPLFPFNLLNYALGLSGIPFVAYLVSTVIFMFPGALAYTWLGYLGGEAAGGAENLASKVLMGLGLLGVALFLPRWLLRWREQRVRC